MDMSRVREVPVPPASKVQQALREVHFCDAYEVSLSRPALSVEQIYRAVFGHAPQWVQMLMDLRGWLVAPFGLMHPDRDAMQSQKDGFVGARFEVGAHPGIFTIHSIEPHEVILGEDDRHLDFRLSVYKPVQHPETVTVSTVVQINNSLGRLYLALIKPFHRTIVRALLQNAVDAGRL
jgi:hypothetical protein